jgi:tetratricopeptide (TPR) repeat protein
MSMPHIAELQTKYGDKVQIVGVTDEEPQVVEEFLKKMAPGGQQTWEQLLTYRLALDANGGTNAAWMQAAGQQGIPCAFIVGRQGKVEWIGHPMTIDKPLQQVVDGTWDIQRGKRESVLRESVNEALTQGNFQRALNLADELLQLDAAESGAQTIRIMALFALGRSDEANAAVAAVIEREQEDAAVLNQLAWLLATGIEKGDVDLQQALRAAERAVELDGGRDANSLDTLARVHFRLEQYEQAISRQRQAIEQAPEGQREAYESVLKEYEAKSAAVPPGQQ